MSEPILIPVPDKNGLSFNDYKIEVPPNGWASPIVWTYRSQFPKRMTWTGKSGNTVRLCADYEYGEYAYQRTESFSYKEIEAEVQLYRSVSQFNIKISNLEPMLEYEITDGYIVFEVRTTANECNNLVDMVSDGGARYTRAEAIKKCEDYANEYLGISFGYAKIENIVSIGALKWEFET